MSWWRPSGDLSQTQLRIINGAVDQVGKTPTGACLWVQGCAGTGKTLVLAHIARRLQSSAKDRSILFLTYTHALTAMIDKTISQSGVKGRASTYKSFLYAKNPLKYDVIFIDEIQDVKLHELTALASRCTHLVVAGDCEQRLYEEANSESAIDEVITFEKSHLIELFRITGYLVKVAQAIMPWTKLAEGDTSKNKRDVSIAVRRFDDCAREAKWVYTEAVAFARPAYPSAILLPHHRGILDFCNSLVDVLGIAASGPVVRFENDRITDYNELNKYLEFHKIPVRYLGNGIGEINASDSRPLVFMMTYNSAKGLDFDNVFLPLLHSRQALVPRFVLAKKAEAERILFFVAITRTRERLVLTYTGEAPHAFIEAMPSDVVSFIKDDPKPDMEEEEELF